MKIEYVPASKPNTFERPIELFGKTYLFSRDENDRCVCEVEEHEAIARLLSIEGYKALEGEQLPKDMDLDEVDLEDMDAEQLVDFAVNNFGVLLNVGDGEEVLLDQIDNLIDVAEALHSELPEGATMEKGELTEKLNAAHLEFVAQEKELEELGPDGEDLETDEDNLDETNSGDGADSTDNASDNAGDGSTDLGEWSNLKDLDVETITKENMVSFAEAVILIEGFGALKADEQRLALEKECLEDFQHNLDRKKSVLNLIKEYAGLIINAAP